MNNLRILFAAMSADNRSQIQSALQSEVGELLQDSVADPVALASALAQDWDVILLGEQGELSLISVVQELRQRERDIPVILIQASAGGISLAETMRMGGQDCLTTHALNRLLPSIQREMVSALLRSSLREQMVADYLMQEIDQLILSGYDLDFLNRRICARMVELFGLKLTWIGKRVPDGRIEIVAAAGVTDYLQHIVVRWDETPEGRGPAGRAICGNQPVVQSSDSPEFEPWRVNARDFGIHSILALPLGSEGNVTGVLMMYSAQSGAFDKLTVSRLSAFAGRVTVAMLGALEQQELRLMHAAMSNAASGMFICRCDGTIEWMNEALIRFSGYSTDEILGANPRLFNSGQHEEAFWLDLWTTILRGENWRGDVMNRKKSGELYVVAQSISPLLNEQGELTHFLAVQQDISEKKRLEAEIHHLAYHDPLTQLPNRMLFRDRVQQSVAQALRVQKKLAVMFIDLDGFKEVNDRYGHSNGDALLEQVAERMRLCVRAGDTVARLGGDEFTVLLLDIAGVESVQRVAQKLLGIAARPFELKGGQRATISLSIGISLYPKDGESFDPLLSHADQAMYEAKQGGKNRYIFYRKPG